MPTPKVSHAGATDRADSAGQDRTASAEDLEFPALLGGAIAQDTKARTNVALADDAGIADRSLRRYLAGKPVADHAAKALATTLNADPDVWAAAATRDRARRKHQEEPQKTASHTVGRARQLTTPDELGALRDQVASLAPLPKNRYYRGREFQPPEPEWPASMNALISSFRPEIPRNRPWRAPAPGSWRCFDDANDNMQAAGVPREAIIFTLFPDGSVRGGVLAVERGVWVEHLVALGWKGGSDGRAAITVYEREPIELSTSTGPQRPT